MPTPIKFTPEEAYALVVLHGSIQAAARAAHTTRNTISGALARGGLTAPTQAPREPSAPGVVVDRTRLRLSDRASRLESELKQTHRDNMTAEEVRESIFRLTATPPEPPEWLIRAPAAPPSQALWFQHRARGIPARWEVHVEDAPTRADTSWLNIWSAA